MRKNLCLYVITFFVIFAIEFGMNSYFSYRLSIENYLFYQNLINILPFAIAFLSLGTPFGVVYLTSLKKDRPVVFLQESNQLVLILSVASIFISVIFYWSEIVGLYVIVAIILGFFNAIKQNVVAFFLAKKNLKVTSFIRLNQKIIYGFTTIVLINIVALTTFRMGLILILGELLGFIVLMLKYKVIRFGTFTKIKSIVSISKYSFFSNAVSMLSVSLPIILLNFYNYDPKEILSFAVAYSLLRYSSLILGPFMQLITPHFSPIKNDMNKVKVYFNKYFLLIFLVSVVVMIFSYFLTEPIITIFFDSKYKNATDMFKILLFSIPLTFLNSYVVIVISSVKSIKSTFRITTVGFLFLSTLLLSSVVNHLSLTIVCFVIVASYGFDLIIGYCTFTKFMKRGCS